MQEAWSLIVVIQTIPKALSSLLLVLVGLFYLAILLSPLRRSIPPTARANHILSGEDFAGKGAPGEGARGRGPGGADGNSG